MKKIIYTTLFIGAILLLNVSFYILSADYRFFVKKLKYGENIPSDNIPITDEYNSSNNKACDCSQNLNNSGSISNSGVFMTGTIQNNNLGTISSGDILQEVLGKFSFANLTKKNYDEYYKMFGLTDEYLSKYDTYVGENIEIYYFPDSSFEDVYNFFQTLTYDVPISINKVDNLGTKTFYINKNNRDDLIRFIIELKGKTFGLKIKNIEYNNVKNILKGF